MEQHEGEIEGLREEAREVVARYQNLYRILGEEVAQRYERLARRYERHMEDIRDQYEAVEEQLAQDLADVEVELPAVPEPEHEPPPRDWLYDSDREFLDQTQRLRDAKL